ncbi:MAG: hypothetical protein KGI39_02625, partial [Patescibacteria group bacterium]|nr:hypothetical protein [Patescibacteria group bacterium]
MKKLLISAVIFIPFAAFGFYFLKSSGINAPNIANYIQATSTEKILEKMKKKMLELPPILSEKDYPESRLSTEGILDETNRQR